MKAFFKMYIDKTFDKNESLGRKRLERQNSPSLKSVNRFSMRVLKTNKNV